MKAIKQYKGEFEWRWRPGSDDSITEYHTILHPDVLQKLIPNNKKQTMKDTKERNQAIKELDQVRAQIARNESKEHHVVSSANKVVEVAESKRWNITRAAAAARSKANAPLLRKLKFLEAEIPALI